MYICKLLQTNIKSESLFKILLCKLCKRLHLANYDITSLFHRYQFEIPGTLKFRCEFTANRVVNIAIKVSLSLVSPILLEYRHQYCRYFLKQVSLAVSPIHFQPKLRYSSATLINGESVTTHSICCYVH